MKTKGVVVLGTDRQRLANYNIDSSQFLSPLNHSARRIAIAMKDLVVL